MDILDLMREQDGDDLAHLIDEGVLVVKNLEGKTLVAREDLDEWRKLLEEVASVLQSQYDRTGIQHDEDLAVICEQTAEYIEGFYLPYDEQGVYIEEAVEAVIGE